LSTAYVRKVREIEKYVDQCYKDILGRPADEGGRKLYANAIIHKVISVKQLPDILRNSKEYQMRIGIGENHFLHKQLRAEQILPADKEADVEIDDDAPNVVWKGHFDWSGYGYVTLNFILALHNLGVNIKPASYGWGKMPQFLHWKLKPFSEPVIRVANLMPTRTVPRRDYNIRYTVWEATLLPSRWSFLLNKETEVWVPSNFCKQVFESCGVTVPIHVFPHGFNPERFNLECKPLYPDEKFTFLWIGDSLPRKNLDCFIKAFTQEFKPNEPVRAILRLYNGKVKHNGRIQVVRQVLPRDQMPMLYQSARCYVLCSRGEGYGLCALEALAMKKPVIYTDWGGHTDFLNEDRGYPISYRLTSVQGMPADFSSVLGRAEWAEPSVTELRQAMRMVYEDYDSALDRAEKGAKVIRRRYTWSNIAKRMAKRLMECSST